MSEHVSSLTRLLHPRSVAIVGLSRDPAKHGARVLDNLRRFGFAGDVWGVNPRWSGPDANLAGVPVFGRLSEVPGSPDVVVLAVPAGSVPGAVEQAGRLQAGAAIVLGGGFTEAGPTGALLQERACAAGRRAGVRLLGPNSAGLIDAGSQVVLSFLTCLDRPTEQLRSGPVALISQSGGTASLVHNAACERGSGLAVSVSTGNEADLGVGELLDAVLSRDDVAAVALMLETVRDGDDFVAAARRALALGKPVVVCKVGRSTVGADVMSTHTGALAAPWRRFEAAFDSLGITVTDTPDEMLDVAELMARSPVPAGTSVGVVTHSGGTAVLVADRLAAVGVEMPPLGPELRESLAPFLQTGAAKNPADLGGILTEPGRFGEAVRLFADAPNLASVVAVSTPHPPAHSVERATGLAELSRSTDKPVLHLWVAGDVGAPGLEVLRRAGVPVTTDVRAMARAVGGLARLAVLRATRAVSPASDGPGASRLPAQPRHLNEAEAKLLLASVGLPTLPSVVAHVPAQARAAAAAIGFPVVVKLVSRDVLHKTELGGVKLDVRDDDGVTRACSAIDRVVASAPGVAAEGYLVEAYRPGVEMIVGIVRDPIFGPMVLVGSGGVQAELFEDVALGLAPLGEEEALRLVRSLRGLPALRGFRGAPAADETALARLVADVSRLPAAWPDIEDVDLNPVIYADGSWWIADAVLRPAAATAG